MASHARDKHGVIDVDKLVEILPTLIRENDTIKGAIITALTGVVATHDDIKELIREMDVRFEEENKRFEAIDRRFDANQTEIASMHSDIKRVSLNLDTLSGRSGDDVEAMVRDLIADILIENKIDVSEI